MNKDKLIAAIIDSLQHDLNNAINAAEQAHLASTDEQSIAETQYDTLAIESAYLAEGQSKIIGEIQQAINQLKQIVINPFTENCAIDIGACVQLAEQSNTVQIENNQFKNNQWYFICPVAGGMSINLEGNSYTIITPQSPVGNALMGKYLEDDFHLQLGAKTLNSTIYSMF